MTSGFQHYIPGLTVASVSCYYALASFTGGGGVCVCGGGGGGGGAYNINIHVCNKRLCLNCCLRK